MAHISKINAVESSLEIKTAPAGNRGLTTTSRLKDSVMADRHVTTNTPASVYRYYDRSGLLLYVGVTGRGDKRNTEHNRTQPWWRYVSSQSVEHYPSRGLALDREKQLIRRFRPPYNVIHNPDHELTRATYEASRAAKPGALPNTIPCAFVALTSDDQPIYRSTIRIGRHFDTAMPPRLYARYAGSRSKPARVIVAREKAGFLIVRLLRAISEEPITVGAKWDISQRPIRMTVTYVRLEPTA